MLSDVHGPPFVIAYLVSFTMVTLGLFNLISALYVEITMAAAKSTEDQDTKRRHRESLRVAHLTKQLLKKFCSAQHFVYDRDRVKDPSVNDISESLQKSENEDLIQDMLITKDLFLVVVQDPEVQKIMGDLSIPPDRANLFDVLDADGTGDLHVTELVHGLLKVRGDARKSDVVASLLAVRAVQDMLRLMEEKLYGNQVSIMHHLGIADKFPSTAPESIWEMKGNSNARSGSINLMKSSSSLQENALGSHVSSS